MNGSRITVVSCSDEYLHSTDQGLVEILMEINKIDKKYKKGVDEKVKEDINIDWNAKITS